MELEGEVAVGSKRACSVSVTSDLIAPCQGWYIIALHTGEEGLRLKLTSLAGSGMEMTKRLVVSDIVRERAV